MEMPSMILGEDRAIASKELMQKYTDKLFPTFNSDKLNFILFARSGLANMACIFYGPQEHEHGRVS